MPLKTYKASQDLLSSSRSLSRPSMSFEDPQKSLLKTILQTNLAFTLTQSERPIINVDLTAITVASIMTVTATIFGLVFRTFFAPLKSNKDERDRRSEDSVTDTTEMWLILEMLNRALLQYGVDANACVKRIACVYVKRAVHEKRMRSEETSTINKIIEGLTR